MRPEAVTTEIRRGTIEDDDDFDAEDTEVEALEPLRESAGPPARRPCRRVTTWKVARYAIVGFAGFLAVGNLLILAASFWARSQAPEPPEVRGVRNFRVLDSQVWRGGAPEPEGYASLAEQGATTIVDLRAESVGSVDEEALGDLGLELVAIPIRDGQTPTPDQVQALFDTVGDADGPVFLHCGAGVGRSGAMSAAYLGATDQADGGERVRANLAVGPPSLEQIVYAATVGDDHSRPNPAIVATSRFLDAPRRIFHNLTP